MESEDDDSDPVVITRKRKSKYIGLHLESEDDEEDCVSDNVSENDGDDGGEEDINFFQGAHSQNQILVMRRIIEAVEFSVRNVDLSADYDELAGPEIAKLQATCKLYANQSTSEKWKPSFITLLERSRMMRIQQITKSDKEILRDGTEGCQICGTAEHRCDTVVEFIGTPAFVDFEATPLGKVDLKCMSTAYNTFDDADDLICSDSQHVPPEYFGMFSCGKTCFEKVVVAFAANNFVADIAYEVRKRLDYELSNNHALVAQFQEDERDPTSSVVAITDTEKFASDLLTKSADIAGALRGAPLRTLRVRQTGNAYAWDRIDEAIRKKASAREESTIKLCNHYARLALDSFGENVAVSTSEESHVASEDEEDEEDEVVILDSSEDEAENEPAPVQPNSLPVQPDNLPVQPDSFVSTRTRAGLARLSR